MSKNRTGIRSSEKILLAARAEFIEKGFEKANMENIAKRAGFNKVMLYYHFNSKEKLLHELIESILADAEKMIIGKLKTVKSIHEVSSAFFLSTIRKILDSNRSLIRLITIELLKGNLDAAMISKLLSEFYGTVAKLAGKNGIDVGDRESFNVRLFFFQTVPLIVYNILAEEMVGTLAAKKKKMDDVFVEKFRETFFQNLTHDKRTKAKTR